MDLRFEIGDTAWWAHPNSEETTVECPDCGGTGRIRVILHEEDEVSIDCDTCKLGWMAPTGRISCYDRTPAATVVTIKGFEFRDGIIKWQTTASYIVDDDRLFYNKEDAVECCKAIAEAMDKVERDRIFKKEKDTKSWAWNAAYHRKCIRDAKKKIEYHTSKLEVANIKQRKPK